MVDGIDRWQGQLPMKQKLLDGRGLIKGIWVRKIVGSPNGIVADIGSPSSRGCRYWFPILLKG
uniref:Uncharacterized protein n=1 Tax=Romanomermis culicivorax TaxID=13658 RepID=A0A915HVQ2_ROMCU